jgi:sensor domain CHASE-containing protein
MNAAESPRARSTLRPFLAAAYVLERCGRLATLLVGLMVIAIGAGVVGGWLTERPDLVRLWCPGPAMRFNTALLAILCGCALVALSARQYRAMQLLGGFAALGAGVSALQNVLGVSLGIDELFYKNHQSAEELAGARMSLNAAICFMLLGTGFVLVRRPGHQQWRFFVAALLASSAMAVAIIDFLGIATGMTVELGWAGTYGMSVPSTIVITLCAISLLAVAARFHTHQGASLAKWFPLLVGNSAIVATFVLWLALQFQDYERIRKTVRAQFDNLDAALNYSLRHHEGVVMRIAKRWDVAGGSTEVAWREDAKNYLQALRGFEALAWVDTGLVVRQFEEREPCHLAETIAGNPVVRETMLAARQQQTALATILIKPTNGDTEVWLMQPLLNAGVDDGCMLAVLDLTRLMPSILERAAMQGQTITLGDHERVLYESPAIADGYDAGLSQSVDLKFANLNWTATAVPSRRWVDSQRSALPDLTLGAGVLFSLLLTIMLRLAVWARDSYRQATLSEARFRAIFESADRAIIAASTDGVIQAFNAAAERMLGYTAEEMIGQQTPEIIHLPSEMRSRAEELTTELGRRIEPGMEVFTAPYASS